MLQKRRKRKQYDKKVITINLGKDVTVPHYHGETNILMATASYKLVICTLYKVILHYTMEYRAFTTARAVHTSIRTHCQRP